MHRSLWNSEVREGNYYQISMEAYHDTVCNRE